MTFLTGMSDLSIFLVEPSSVQSQFIEARLGDLDILPPRVFRDGATVLAAMHERLPDLVISAMYLSDMTGAELVEKMRVDDALKGVAFILISSETKLQYLDPVRQAGACAILPKPFESGQLRTALSATLDYLKPGNLSLDGGDIDIENLRVLVVDDSRSARTYSRQVLGNMGIQHIIEAENGLQAAEIIQEQFFDLVVTDYNMPEMDGRELVEFIRGKSWQSSVPVLMISSEKNQNWLAAVEQAGVSAICDKPFEPALIKSLLEKMLAPSGR